MNQFPNMWYLLVKDDDGTTIGVSLSEDTDDAIEIASSYTDLPYPLTIVRGGICLGIQANRA